MTLLMMWCLAVAMLVGAAAAALDRVASLIGAPRRFVWMGAVLATLIAPVTLLAPRSPAVRGPIEPSSVRLSTSASADPRTVINSAKPSRDAVERVDRRTLPITWNAELATADRWLTRVWIAASALLLAFLCMTIVRLRFRRAGWPTAEIDGRPVYVTADVGPAVVGIFRPRMVLPRWALILEEQTRAILLHHELEHVRAGDTRMLFAGELALVALPWNIALWWIVRRLRIAIEIDCDARVIRQSGDAHAYGSMLLAISERHAAPLRLATSLVEPRSSLEERINAITASRVRRPLLASIPLLSTAALALVTVAWTPVPRAVTKVTAQPERLKSTRQPVTPLTRRVPVVAPVVSPPIARLSVDSARLSSISSPVRSEPLAVQASDSVLAKVGYYFRKRDASGFFMDGELLEPRASSFSETLRVLPGFRISPSDDSTVYAIADARAQPNGCVNLFIDGSMWMPAGPGLLDAPVRPADLLAIEAYRRESTPPQFASRDGNPCATIIVWTQRR